MTYPVLYLFPRTDLASMTPGKAMAHAAHAANAFVHTMLQHRKDLERLASDPNLTLATYNFDLMNAFRTWETATPQGFGTTIVLQATWLDVITTINNLNMFGDIHVGVSTDPTYPYVVPNEVAALIPADVDTMPRHPGAPGQMVMYRCEDTCAWTFGMKDNPYLRMALDKFSLHP